MIERLTNIFGWAAVVAIGVGDAAGVTWARAVTAVLLVLWLAFVAVPWAFWWVRSGRVPGTRA